MNDKKLHEIFVQIGRERNKLTYRLLALLPEIFSKQIYKKQGYETIYEYAGKLAGLSKSVVEKTLRVEKHIVDKPALKKAVVKVGIHKVALVASLATSQNEAQWADKAENMSKAALIELSKEVRSKQNPIPGNGFGEKSIPGDGFGGLFQLEEKRLGEANLESSTEAEFSRTDSSTTTFGSCAAAPQKLSIELDEEMQFLFLKLKKKMGKNLSNKAALRQILSKLVETEFPEKRSNTFTKTISAKVERSAIKTNIYAKTKLIAKNKLGEKSIPGDGFGGTGILTGNKFGEKVISGDDSCKWVIPMNALSKKITRYIPAAQKRITIKKTNGKCGYPNCNRPADAIHHCERFSANKSHESIIPTCKIHHEFAHNGLIHDEKAAPQKWQLGFGEMQTADIYYRKYRRKVWELMVVE